MKLPVLSQARECGPCTMCCMVPKIIQLDKPSNTPCTHVTRRGCGIYDDRPAVCRDFHCNWRYGWGSMTERPDRLGFYITTGMTATDSPSVIFHVPEGSWGIWERRAYARRLIERTVDNGGTVYIICGDKRRVFTKDSKVLAIAEELIKNRDYE